MIWCLFFICCLRILLNGTSEHSTLTHGQLHTLCLSYLEWRDLPQIYNGLICGSKNIGTSTERLFLNTGLYHLLVVSGSHLVLIDGYLEKTISKNFKLKWALLLIYTEICLLQAPVVRALSSYTMATLTRYWHLGWTLDRRVLASGLLTLIVDPTLLQSLSLQLSWMAALCISLPLSGRLKTFLFLLYLFPLLGAQHPWTAFNNWIFAGLFEAFLFPFTVLSTLIPGTTFIAQWVWTHTLPIIAHLPQTTRADISATPPLAPWLAIFGTHLAHFWIRK